MIQFTVPGQPLPAERPRTVRRGRARVTITPDRTLAAEARVAAAFRAAHPDHRPDATTAWALAVVFARTTKANADLDNLIKTVQDGLNGALYADDRQVAEYGRMVRVLGVPRGTEHTEVWAWPLAPAPVGECATLDASPTPEPERSPA